MKIYFTAFRSFILSAALVIASCFAVSAPASATPYGPPSTDQTLMCIYVVDEATAFRSTGAVRNIDLRSGGALAGESWIAAQRKLNTATAIKERDAQAIQAEILDRRFQPLKT